MLFERAAGWLLGKVKFSVEGGSYEKLLNRCTDMGLTLAGLRPTPTGVTGWMPARDYKKIHRAALHCHCRTRVVKKRGLPFLLRRYWGRWGLLLGPAVFVALCLYLPGTLWCVRYYDVPQRYQQEIGATLAANGVYAGVRPTDEQLRRVRQIILLQSEELADVSLNFVEGRLVVEVSERTARPELEKHSPGDIVASKAGIIDHLDVAHGFAAVLQGQRVSEGELLVSGTYIDDKTGSVVITPAEAKVIARTEKIYTVNQPLHFVAHVPTGEVLEYRALLLGDRRLELGSMAQLPQLYSEKVRYEQLTVFGFALPAVLETRSVYPEEESEILLTEETAKNRAKFRLDRALAEDGRTEQVISAVYTGEMQGEEYVATLTVERLEDIALAIAK